MSDINELNAFSGKINLVLLNDIVKFVVETAAASYAFRQQLSSQYLFLSCGKSDEEFQKKYGFLYLGELLERYEQRFGMTIQDRRAIAMALGYTVNIATDEMFVGNQWNDFVKSVRQYADGDIYLTGALYLLSQDEVSQETFEKKILSGRYEHTEELIFIISLFSDFERVFTQLKSQVLQLLGHERSISVLGNTSIINWLIARLQPMAKSMRSKDARLIRALCALPSAYLKKGNKFYKVLMEYGYTPLEIAYANMQAVMSQTADKVLRLDSIVTEKIAVNLFRQVLGHSEALDTNIYKEMDWVFSAYGRFSIRCYGEQELINTLKDVRIKNAKTFAWFGTHVWIGNPVFSEFNIKDAKWDSLAKELKEADYRFLFETQLMSQKDKDIIQECIDQYDRLTGKDYLQSYYESDFGSIFETLICAGIIDLWTAFRNSLDKNGAVTKPQMIKRIGSYIHGLKNIDSFRFCEQFFPQYGAQGYFKYFENNCRSYNAFSNGLLSSSYYNNSESVKLDIKRQYLEENEKGRSMVLQWLQEYLFQYKTELYVPFVCAVLKDVETANLLPRETQRKMFDLVIDQPCLSKNEIENLRQTYLTEAELAAEKEAQDAAKELAAKEAAARRKQDVQEYYTKTASGSMESLLKFIKHYNYDWVSQPIACRIVAENLPEILEEKHSELDSAEIQAFIDIFQILLQKKTVTFAEMQGYISKIKEVTIHAGGGSEVN